GALAGLYAGKDNYDSALVYYRRTAQTAGNDTAFAKDRKDALGNAVRTLVGRAQSDAAAQNYARLRASMDSIDRGFEADSTTLARMNASSQSRKARGRRLTPADQQTFTRDSTGRAQAVAQARTARATVVQQMAVDSGKLRAAYYQLRDSTGLLAVAQRLVQLDPLNRSSLKLLAAAWDLRGKRDSTLKYVTQADSLVAVEVTVSSFVPDSAGAALTLLATNLRPAPSKPFRLTVEFLDRQGKPVASEARELPAIAPQESQQLDLKLSGKGIIGWRYRPS